MPYKDPEKRKAYLKEKSRQHYLKNKEIIKQRTKLNSKVHKKSCQDWVLEYLQMNPCTDCAESDPVVLEFDHREEEVKLFNISDKIGRISIDKIQSEVAKCDVRCANCHRRMTYRRAGRTHRG